jgi:hypothetical protein
MKSRFKTRDGLSITVQPLPHSNSVMVQFYDCFDGKMMHMVVPNDLTDVFAQAVKLAGEWKPTPPANVSLASDATGSNLGISA